MRATGRDLIVPRVFQEVPVGRRGVGAGIRRLGSRIRRFVLTVGLGHFAAGCASPPGEDTCGSIVDVGCDGGFIDEASGDWLTATWNGPRIFYPAYSTIRLCHGLAHEPSNAFLWASFSPNGPLALQIGSVFTVVSNCNGVPGVTDRSILIRNSGGQAFYVRIVLSR